MSKKGKTSTMFDDVCLSTPFLQPTKMNMSDAGRGGENPRA